jgi:hypothetical protein
MTFLFNMGLVRYESAISLGPGLRIAATRGPDDESSALVQGSEQALSSHYSWAVACDDDQREH